MALSRTALGRPGLLPVAGIVTEQGIPFGYRTGRCAGRPGPERRGDRRVAKGRWCRFAVCLTVQVRMSWAASSGS